MKAVRFDRYGDLDVLRIAEVPVPEPGNGQVLVRVKAASINPGEAKIRAGALHSLWPATFPSGEGSDVAGLVAETGPGVKGFSYDEEVIGFTHHRASHAEYVVVDQENLVHKPAGVSWEAAGSLGVAGSTAFACVQEAAIRPGDRVAVSGAAGGVGSIAVQLAREAGAEVVGIAGPSSHEWLERHGVKPVAYGEGLMDKLQDSGLHALIDTHGDGYVKLATELGIPRDRIVTIADFLAAREYGTKSVSSGTIMSGKVLADLASLIASGKLEVPVVKTFPLDEIREAFRLLERGHIHGKIVLIP